MVGKLFGRALAVLLLAGGGAVAADPVPPESASLPTQAPPASQPPPAGAQGQKPPEKPAKPAPPAEQPAAPRQEQTAAATQPPSGDREAPSEENPNMLGDFPGLFVLRTFSVPAFQTITTTQSVTKTTITTIQVVNPDNGKLITVKVPVTTTSLLPVQHQTTAEMPVTVRVPFPFAADFKIAENESPRPENRFFLTYNYYSGVAGPSTASAVSHLDTAFTSIDGNPATISTLTPGVPAPRIDLHREVVGFEKTFLGGNASIGLRAPYVEQEGAEAIGGNDFGDITVLLKYAFLNNRRTGDVLSGGLAVTLPTGPGIPLTPGEFHSTLVQPWTGYIWNFNRLYVHGFTSVVVPTDSRDVTLLFNDVGVGYKLYRSANNRLISAIVPSVEAHLTTPLNHRDETSPITVPDLLVITAGSHFDISRRSTLSIGVAAPVTGPRAFDVEAQVQFNWRF